MPKKYTDEAGNEVELLTKEEQQAEIDKKVAELTVKKEEVVAEKKEVTTTPSLEDIDKELSVIKQTFVKKEQDEKEEWFNEQVSGVLDNEEDKKKVRQYFDILEKKPETSKKVALADALTLVTRKNISPFNGVTNYNQNSSVPGAEKEGDELTKLKNKFNSSLPPGFRPKK